MDIKFNTITFNSDFHLEEEIINFDNQIKIFEGMSLYLKKYLDIPQLEIKNFIVYCAYTWQKNYQLSFDLNENAIIQEKLILADQFRDEVIKNLSPFLLIPSELDSLKKIIVNALLYYMKEFS